MKSPEPHHFAHDLTGITLGRPEARALGYAHPRKQPLSATDGVAFSNLFVAQILVFEKLGLAILRNGWFNVDLFWAAARYNERSLPCRRVVSVEKYKPKTTPYDFPPRLEVSWARVTKTIEASTDAVSRSKKLLTESREAVAAAKQFIDKNARHVA